MEKEINFYNIIGESYIQDEILNRINSINFNYCDVSKEQYDNTILTVLKKINSNTLGKSGNIDKWENGWTENLNEFKKTNDLNLLIPKYIHSDNICRHNKTYIKTSDSNCEINVLSILIQWMLSKYLKDCNDIFEFGCGSGYNLVTISNLYPEKTIHGLDWAQSSVDIIEHIKKIYNYNIKGYKFDMFNPDYTIDMPEGSGVFTVGALEQTHTNFYKFVDLLLLKKPKIICHFEPILEFYNEDNLLDYLSIQFHIQRNYLNGYYTHLKQLESENKIKILKSKRIEFGSLFQDSWSIIIWEIL